MSSSDSPETSVVFEMYSRPADQVAPLAWWRLWLDSRSHNGYGCWTSIRESTAIRHFCFSNEICRSLPTLRNVNSRSSETECRLYDTSSCSKKCWKSEAVRFRSQEAVDLFEIGAGYGVNQQARVQKYSLMRRERNWDSLYATSVSHVCSKSKKKLWESQGKGYLFLLLRTKSMNFNYQ